MFDKKKMFSAASSAGNGLVDIHNPGSCVEARQRPLGGERKSKMLKQTIIFAAIAGLVLALAPASHAGLVGQLGVLDEAWFLANPTNPETTVAWAAGDAYHLVFVTSVNRTFPKKEEDLNVYNQFVTDVANNVGAYTGSVVAAHGWSWKAIGSVQAGFPIPSPNHHAYNNAVVSAPVYNLNAELVATGYADIWNSSLANPIKAL